MDRQDIDALLIGALYGELTPADEAKLATHLESHPGDRGALDDLKVARQAVHESRIFAVQLEPPQAVSALLLQEAHRRAPKRVVASEEPEGWFARFTRNFMRHPAMAAATMLVLVLGGAGILYMKKGEQFAAKEVASEGAPLGRSQLEAAQNAATAPQAAPPLGGADDTGAASADVPAQGSAAFAADLLEGDQAKQELAAASDKKAAESARDRWSNESRAKDQESAKLKKSAPSRGMIVTTERAPMDFDDAKPAKNASKEDSAFGWDGESTTGGKAGGTATAGKTAKGGAPGGAAGGGAATSTGSLAMPDNNTANAISGAGASGRSTADGYAQPPPAPVAQGPVANRPSPAPAPTTTATTAPRAPEPKPEPSKVAADKPAAKAPAAAAEKKAPATTTVTKSAAPPTAKPTDAPKTEGAKREDSSLVAWAKGEHARAVALAKNGDCTAAAKVALNVSNRAASYYSQNMATDRSLKQCAQYINAERDREAERSQKARAQKRVNADESAPTSVK